MTETKKETADAGLSGMIHDGGDSYLSGKEPRNGSAGHSHAGLFGLMKYAAAVLIIVYIVFLLFQTSVSSRSFDTVASAVKDSLASSNLAERDGQRFKRNFGLNSADFDGVLYYSSESVMSAEEVLLVKVKSASQIRAVTEAIEERIAARTDAFEEYAPDQAKILEDAQLSVRGRFVFYAASPDGAKYREVFDSSL